MRAASATPKRVRVAADARLSSQLSENVSLRIVMRSGFSARTTAVPVTAN